LSALVVIDDTSNKYILPTKIPKKRDSRCCSMFYWRKPKIRVFLNFCFLNQTVRTPCRIVSHRISINQNTQQILSFSKVNGCELPGGSILRVEPSDPYYKLVVKTPKSGSRIEEQQSQSQAKVGIGRTTPGAGQTKDSDRGIRATSDKQLEEPGSGAAHEEETDEGLDDFFASLE